MTHPGSASATTPQTFVPSATTGYPGVDHAKRGTGAVDSPPVFQAQAASAQAASARKNRRMAHHTASGPAPRISGTRRLRRECTNTEIIPQPGHPEGTSEATTMTTQMPPPSAAAPATTARQPDRFKTVPAASRYDRGRLIHSLWFLARKKCPDASIPAGPRIRIPP